MQDKKWFCILHLRACNAFIKQEQKAILTINYHENKEQREFTFNAIKKLKRRKNHQLFQIQISVSGNTFAYPIELFQSNKRQRWKWKHFRTPAFHLAYSLLILQAFQLCFYIWLILKQSIYIIYVLFSTEKLLGSKNSKFSFR